MRGLVPLYIYADNIFLKGIVFLNSIFSAFIHFMCIHSFNGLFQTFTIIQYEADQFSVLQREIKEFFVAVEFKVEIKLICKK